MVPVAIMITACYPEFNATLDELDLAITKYDKDQDFGDLSSFYLYDTVIYVSDKDEVKPHVDESQDSYILSQVRQNLLTYGWTEVTDTAGAVEPDVSILVSVLEVDIYFYYNYWWDWWYWYPWDWWYPGWPGYPGYPVYPGYPGYGYTVGTVMIEMINMDEITAPQTADTPPSVKLPIVWTGAINGILAGSNENIQKRLNKQMAQVFDQSTYLHIKTPK